MLNMFTKVSNDMNVHRVHAVAATLVFFGHWKGQIKSVRNCNSRLGEILVEINYLSNTPKSKAGWMKKIYNRCLPNTS